MTRLRGSCEHEPRSEAEEAKGLAVEGFVGDCRAKPQRTRVRMRVPELADPRAAAGREREFRT